MRNAKLNTRKVTVMITTVIVLLFRFLNDLDLTNMEQVNTPETEDIVKFTFSFYPTFNDND